MNVPVPEDMAKFCPPAMVRPPEAVSSPAEVIVPEPVVEILLDVEIVFAVAIVPKPEAMEPEARAPTVVREEVTTFEARVVPVKLPAGFETVELVPATHD